MNQPLRASDVSRQLGDAGHVKAEWDNVDWEHGYRSVQRGPCLVHTFHDGPGEEDHLSLYALALKNLGYHVVAEQQDNGGRHRLAITRPRIGEDPA